MNDPRKQQQDPTDEVEPIGGDDLAAAEAPLEAEVRTPEPEPSVEEQLTAERDELKEKWLRALAELDNQRKRARREVVDARRFAHAEVLRPLLEIADNFERALQAMDGGEAESTESAEGVRQGVTMIQQKLQSVLRERGVEAIAALGAEFDPALHEAVAQLPSEEHAAGIVIDVVQQGYRFGEMVLRPARVVIAS